ncbi:glucose-6-phosphate 1-dehydrogenase [Hamiltosporidium tvaerminnensis]|uniref:Glucose-6-phosphate 1-dehydrogenase n=2 Tax=Hamiltosporidium TaxID=1176354 RepID=A0A4V2JYF1_9MICR|nr:Glucose-6-phosphate 1-dehydrogenase [Hamiltosporidium tvaerminnensis]TBU05450.1 glucose-6-phosphate 1-dehydrogenase [Hamiltosporidium tvaerminnensis]TBU09810.1 glucose-6-phosphate 1-dehydrogenase [Hamiltosporidium magnivora]TBU20813.1 glucose-6-phosphate 1-dehydrogenase [Hamiltosporidium tvaerminnensis]
MKIVIFGASGDLAKRKLFPALAKVEGGAPDLKIIGYSRAKLEDNFITKITEFETYKQSFLDKIMYISGEYSNLEKLKDFVDEETLFYFSVPPIVYPTLFSGLSIFSNPKIAVEKPFGNDLKSFLNVRKFISQHENTRIYLIDHYLLKPMCVALPKILSKRDSIRCLLNNNCVRSVEIYIKEELGIEGRSYFNDYGLVKDVVQNHLSEIFCLLGCTYELSMDSDSLKEKRVQFLEKVKEINIKYTLFGQYEEYNKELGFSSDTETFVLVPLFVENERWKKVPFVLIAGKGLNEKRTEIRIEFKRKSLARVCEFLDSSDQFKNHIEIPVKDIEYFELIINVFPDNEIYFRFKSKEGFIKLVIYESCDIDRMMVENYGKYKDHEIIFNSLINNHEFACAGVDEAEILWNLFDEKKLMPKSNLFFYRKGVDMPDIASDMIVKLKEKNDSMFDSFFN